MMADSKQNFSILLEQKSYTDLVLDCQGTKFNVHRSVVCLKSAFLDAACSNGFLETFERTINLPDDDPESIGRLVEYLYSSTYTTPAKLSAPGQPINQLLVHILMFELAVKYHVNDLDQVALQNFRLALKTMEHGEARTCSFIVEAIREIYMTIPEREGKLLWTELFLTDLGQLHMDIIFKSDEFKALCEEVGGVGQFCLIMRMEYDSQRIRKAADENKKQRSKLKKLREELRSIEHTAKSEAEKSNRLRTLIEQFRLLAAVNETVQSRLKKEIIDLKAAHIQATTLGVHESVIMYADDTFLGCESMCGSKKFRLELRVAKEALKVNYWPVPPALWLKSTCLDCGDIYATVYYDKDYKQQN